jgi:pheromone shutdown protein TraB
MIGLRPSQCLQCWSLFWSVIGSLLPIIFSLLLLAFSVHDTWSSTLIASLMHDRCLSTCWWDFLWLHYSFSASLDLVARLPSIIVALIAALTSLSVLMSTGILISFSEVKHLVKVRSFKGLQSVESILVWLINLVDPTFFHANSFGSFSAFPAPTSPPLWQQTSIDECW